MPLAIVPDPRDSTVHFVVQQGGRIRVVKNGILQTNDFLNITSAVLCCDEQGLFSLVFPPDAATNDRFWVNFTRKPDGATVVARFRRSGDPLVADPTSRLDLMWPGASRAPAAVHRPAVRQSQRRPHGVRARRLPLHRPGRRRLGQRSGAPRPGSGHAARQDAPHRRQRPRRQRQRLRGAALQPVRGQRAGDALTEIWAFGMRNPWRFTFDDVARGGTGALVIGDVGQNAWEEINYEPAGQRRTQLRLAQPRGQAPHQACPRCPGPPTRR